MTHDPTDIAAQDDARREDAKRAKISRQQEVEDLKWLMGAKRGRRIMYRILQRAGVWKISFNTNAMTMAFNEGNRNQGLAITAVLMSACPELWARMIEENTEKDNSNE